MPNLVERSCQVKKYFTALFPEPEIPIGDEGKDISLPSYKEVRTAIARLKNNKAAVKSEIWYKHQLLRKILSHESMPDDWNLRVLCPIHKNGDATVYANYREISLFKIAYKVLSNVLCERLKTTVNRLDG